MAQSLHDLLIHIVFSTKNREKLIDSEIQSELYRYLAALWFFCASYLGLRPRLHTSRRFAPDETPLLGFNFFCVKYALI